MTISYSRDISDGQGILCIFKLFSRWSGSVYKLVWFDLVIYIMIYYALNFSYSNIMGAEEKKIFENIVYFCQSKKNAIPLSFLLGFFVNGVVRRWWSIYMAIPWLNKLAFMTQSLMGGITGDDAVNLRLTVMRYANLSWILMMHRISDQIANRFKGYDEEIPEKRYTKRYFKRLFMNYIFKTEDKKKDNPCIRKILMSINKDSKCREFFECMVTEEEMNAFEKSRLFNIRQCNDMKTIATILKDPQGQKLPSGKFPDSIKNDNHINAEFLLNSREDPITIANGRTHDEEEEMNNGKGFFRKFRENFFTSPLNDGHAFSANHYEYWIPLQWAVRVLQHSYSCGYIAEPRELCKLIEEIDRLRSKMHTLNLYSTILLPLVYTQVVIIAAYSYFLCQLFASQLSEAQSDPSVDTSRSYPIFLIFEFLFLIGWLKVAMCVMNPFGDDDEDFSTSQMLDYNLELSVKSASGYQAMYPPHLAHVIIPKRYIFDKDYKPDIAKEQENIPQTKSKSKNITRHQPFDFTDDSIDHESEFDNIKLKNSYLILKNPLVQET